MSPDRVSPDRVIPDREAQVTRAFVSISGALVHGYDTVDLLTELTRDCAEMLDVASAGLLLADGAGVLHVLAASSEATLELETFQVQRDEGPCRDCFESGKPVLVPRLEEASQCWPAFVPHARAAGFVSVHAVPMRMRDACLGALGLFGTTEGVLSDADLSLAQSLADVASIALVQQQASLDKDTVNQQLQTALSSRITVEQAKGVLSQRGGIGMAEAFGALRQYARDHNLKLADLAQQLIERRLDPQRLLDEVASRSPSGKGRTRP